MPRISIEINDLKIFARHGVFPQERKCGNLYSVSLSLVYPADDAAINDALDGTIDYSEAVEIIAREMEQPSALIEHVAWRIRLALLKRWPKIEGGCIRLEKPAPPISAEIGSAAVKVEW